MLGFSPASVLMLSTQTPCRTTLAPVVKLKYARCPYQVAFVNLSCFVEWNVCDPGDSLAKDNSVGEKPIGKQTHRKQKRIDANALCSYVALLVALVHVYPSTKIMKISKKRQNVDLVEACIC